LHPEILQIANRWVCVWKARWLISFYTEKNSIHFGRIGLGLGGTMEKSSEQPAGGVAGAKVSTAGMRVIRLMVGRGPQTMTELIRAAGVTRTAVTEQLNELVACGYAERSSERLEGRGRPRHLYSATDAATLKLFASNKRLVVPTIWRAIDRIGGEPLKQRILKQVSLELANHYKRRIHGKTPARRFRQLARLFAEEGSVVDVAKQRDGRLVMSKRSCAFMDLFEKSPSGCCVGKIMRHVVGAPVRRTAWRCDGAPCCQFALACPRKR